MIVTVQRALLAVAVVAMVGCREREQPAADRAPAAPAAPSATNPEQELPADASVADRPLVVTDLEIEGSERATLEALGAERVWNAVVERERYLARRGDRGIVYGRAGGESDSGTGSGSESESGSGTGHRWLIDDRKGDGSLALRTDLPDAVAPGDRVVVWGAWQVDDQRRWYWRADRIARLPAKPAHRRPDPYAAPAPGHRIATLAEVPAGAVPLAELTTSGGGLLFQVVRGPLRPSDGWAIADSSRDEAAAILRLPGEREAYGGQEMRSDDELWHLRFRVTYVVRVRRWRTPKQPGELPTLQAISAPFRVDPRALVKDR